MPSTRYKYQKHLETHKGHVQKAARKLGQGSVMSVPSEKKDPRKYTGQKLLYYPTSPPVNMQRLMVEGQECGP